MRRWIVPLAALLCALLLLLLLVGAMGGWIRGLLNAAGNGASAAGDPMFAPPVELTTRPPALRDEAGSAPTNTLDDRSANWHYDTLTSLDSEGYAIEP